MVNGLRKAKLLVRFPMFKFEPGQAYSESSADCNTAGEIWAIALSADGQYLASTAIDGRINVWDNLADRAKIREFQTKKSFGMSIDLV